MSSSSGFRDGDAEISPDSLVDSPDHAAHGRRHRVLLLTPKTGRPGYVEPSDIGEAAQTAGSDRDHHDGRRQRLVRHAPGGPPRPLLAAGAAASNRAREPSHSAELTGARAVFRLMPPSAFPVSGAAQRCRRLTARPRPPS